MFALRPFYLALASGAALCPLTASALGLGEITLNSALNQPLDARIELVELGQLDASDFKVRLATADDYQKTGVERVLFLSDLRFTPILSGGAHYVRVQSRQPVREPYLNFLVEVIRPGGRQLREYTVLIDPPESAAYQRQAAQLQSPAQPDARRSIEPSRAKPSAALGQHYLVQKGDNLWKIARRLQQEGSTSSVENLMADILALNPQAFVLGDAGRLKVHSQLLLPDNSQPESMLKLTQTAASVEASDALAANQTSDSAELAAVQDKQLQADQALQASQDENQQLHQQLGELQNQLDQLQQSLDERSVQVRQLQAQLAEQPKPINTIEAPVAPIVTAQASAEAAPSTLTDWRTWLAGLGLGALLLSALTWRRRTTSKESPAPSGLAQSTQHNTEQNIAQATQTVPVPTWEQPAAANSDPLSAADVYLAYGKHDAARDTLQQALVKDPQRDELRLRLLEVLALQGDELGCQQQWVRLRNEPQLHDSLERLRQQYPMILGEEALGKSHGANPAQAQAQTAESLSSRPAALKEEDFRLNLDELPLDADWDQLEPFQAPEVTQKTQQATLETNLKELPEVFELNVNHEGLSPFGDLQDLPDHEQQDDEFVGEFRSLKSTDDLSYLESDQQHLQKLNQALAYIEQGDLHEACDILRQLVEEGSEEQKQEAQQLLARIA